ncbi:conserved Plasmodium protein, unknown function [Plasmodium berghei]|uniref:RING-type domain-containing protein n=2 Tax=Plasmodium berghei TaxID=5821 RepID=A0A509AH94_PLABA|nr:conserved protein, unknown function [Plasmodium berghei ANKA]CXH88741.1 conserved Plasmodium protein, unknown function [Plasmodium berghei]SCL90236.1 conserved Plasmodium protein, unknown function [Plasmodium berghei]SCM15249.1 conserved Plasmodium protein, unknown function [Plasmodium berghei]SCM17044.1 conserved Plasmodium protein, unknown function [Plasmodium berghei]SCN21916.1 conserved Plasmodium protein, unknown function [Plasmodium berghei]|eukprot:XP_034419824.1 conserved protein, unknown function [Plasmodium berghei ANKA]
MYIQYRLFSEHSLWRVLEINKNENYILVSELKNIIRKQSNINYNNKIDIYFSLYQNEDNEEDINKKSRNISKEIKYLDVDDKIYNGNKILVHRDVKKKNTVHDITHIAKKEIILDVEEKQKVNLPNEFLCKICNYMLIESYIIVCNNNCGYSVCKSCILFYIFSCIIKEDEKKKNYIDLSLIKNDDNIIKCPICKGVLKYCIINKKMELTLKKLQDERNDIDSFNFIIQERNNKFGKIIEKMKIQNFDYSSIENRSNDGTNIYTLFNSHIFKTIEEKYICSTNNNNKANEQIQIEEKSVLNHFLYLMDSNKLNSIKEYQMIYIDFDSCIFDTIQKMNIRNISEHINGNQLLQNILHPYEVDNNSIPNIVCDSGIVKKIDNERLDNIKYEKNENMNSNAYNIPNIDQNNAQEEIGEKLYIKNKTYIIPISFVGGETSYSLIGVFYISDLVTSFNNGNTKDRNEKHVNNKIENFMMKWHANDSVGNHINKENIMNKLKNGDIYKVEYVNKYEKTCFIPVRKQPLYNIINTKRNKTKKKTNIEIVLELKKFMEIVLTVDNYIRYGSRPNNYEIKKVVTSGGDDISVDTGMGGGINIPFNNMDENEKKNMNVQKNKEIQDISYIIGNNQDINSQIIYEGTLQSNYPSENIYILTKHTEFQEIYEILYSTKTMPVSIQNNFNINNPYADYCAILPFLTKEEFLFFRKLQRIYKEKYLKKLYKHVKENNLNINIFSNAINSIFFSTIR